MSVQPVSFQESGALIIAPPFIEPVQKAIDTVWGQYGSPVDFAHGVAILQYSGKEIEMLMAALRQHLTPNEMRVAQAIFVGPGEMVGPSNFGRSTSLATLANRVDSRWLLDLIDERRVFTLFQPIVSRAEVDQPYAFECFIRGLAPDGAVIPADRLFASAEAAGLVYELETISRQQCIAHAAAAALEGRLFINFNPCVVFNLDNWVETSLTAASACGITPGQIVFEMTAKETIVEAQRVGPMLEAIRKAGFGIALDDLGAGVTGIGFLAALQPDYIKLSADLIVGIHQNPFKQSLVEGMLRESQRLGISVVAQGIESEEDFDWVFGHGADFFQGYYISEAGNPPPTPQSKRMEWRGDKTA